MSTTDTAKRGSAFDSMNNVIVKIGRAMGNVVGVLYQAGRDAVNTVIQNVLPFMAFIAMIIGIINATGFGEWLAERMEPLAGSLGGLLLISVFCAIPIISPILGPGAVIAQIVGTAVVGPAIASGSVPPQYALPALFAIDPQVGCDFIPVGLSLAEARPETVEIGVPAVLFSRLVTGPLSVVLAYFASFGLYSTSN